MIIFKLLNPIFRVPICNEYNNRINSLNFEELDSIKYSAIYIDNLAIGVFNFLKYEGNKHHPRFYKALNWLKTTDFYKKNKSDIDKNFHQIDKIEFKKKLNEIDLLDFSFNETSLDEILKQSPSKYYLIDFWATWCGPCIDGVKKMHKMDFPENVAVISLSVDKMKDKDKWVKKTKELGQKISYLIDDSIVKNKEFLKFIELQTIPRYVLIDKKMNLIDISFLKPQEPGFLKKLNELE